MKLQITALAAALALAGCTDGAKRIDSQGTQTITSLNQIDIQDWNEAAEKLVSSLLESGVLEKAPDLPAVMAVSRITNNTSQQIDIDTLTKKIRVALNKTGKVVTTTVIGAGGRVEDPLAADTAAMNNFVNGEKNRTTMPYFTLSGKILESFAKAGAKKQVTYTFQLSLTTVKNGLAVWEDEQQITKQGRSNSVGW